MARILIADDDSDYLAAFRKGIAALGHEVETATGGDAAVARIQTDSKGFDVVFLDFVMADGGGLSTLHKIADLAPDTPIVVITGRAEMVDSPLFQKGMRRARLRLSKTTKLHEFDKIINDLLEIE
ncbi:response regulator [Maritimibacter dapengensis]|uniref:Response regulator n=1 Tax=Maritimibacter dapengensis TaxID=2836868 RepID=A0ABS6T328_9RHOB|nr:response regulator [Maritimibacter dapengensis]MBV7378961.1 response regulator [Maritimibacter dapengensis]